MKLRGSVRKISICRVQNPCGGYDLELVVEPYSRYSDHEVNRFYPDVVEEFSFENAIGL
jgi:hypothetical protein